METDPYKILALALDALPNGFPAAEDGRELRLLERLFTPEDAALACRLSPRPESPEELAARIGGDPAELRTRLKGMFRRGLIEAARSEAGLGYRLMPFVVGIYEMQIGNLDPGLAQLIEAYFKDAFKATLAVKPHFHRVIPIGKSVRADTEILPHESAAGLVEAGRAWGVLDCICRKQKALIGEACGHPLDNCMVIGQRPGAFDDSEVIRAVTRDEALATLRRAAEAGLVHSVGNNKEGLRYICNCCTCSCGILRGMASLGVANVIARSAFVNKVDESSCTSCGRCVDACPFEAITPGSVIRIDKARCVGCGLCVPVCPGNALGLVRRPESEILPVPETLEEWGAWRMAARGS